MATVTTVAIPISLMFRGKDEQLCFQHLVEIFNLTSGWKIDPYCPRQPAPLAKLLQTGMELSLEPLHAVQVSQQCTKHSTSCQ